MFRILIARLLSSALVVAGVVVVVFVLARVVGDPVELMIQPGLSDDEIAELRRSLGTDKPLWQQFVTFVGNVARGDFGISPWQGEPALQLVLERVPATLALAGAAMALAALIAIVVGAVSALRRGSWIDRGAMSVVLLGQSVPNFWLGLMLILLFATTLSWLPSAGYGTAALAVGAPGGHGIISGVAQTISNLIDFGMTPVEAVSAPRLHCEGEQVELEARFPRSVARALEALGHPVRHSLYSFDYTSGRPHVVSRASTGELNGGADPRGGGMALHA